MPRRKNAPIDAQAASRPSKHNTSMAKFVLADGDTGSLPASPMQAPKPQPYATPPTGSSIAAAPPSTAAATTTAAASTATLSADMDMDRPTPEKGTGHPKEGREPTTIEDLNLPKSIITRLAKGVLPPNTQIQANAILAMSKSATVFINHLAHFANQRTNDSGKKTIMPNDVLDALKDVEFSDFKDMLQAEFKKFNEIQTTKRNTYRRRVAAAKKGLPYHPADPHTSTPSGSRADASMLSSASSQQGPRSKKHKPNGPDDSSMMDLDGGDATEDFRDASDAESEPDQEEEEEEEEEEEADEDEEAEEDDEEEEDEDEEEGESGDENGDQPQDALEPRHRAEVEDEALDNGSESDRDE